MGDQHVSPQSSRSNSRSPCWFHNRHTLDAVDHSQLTQGILHQADDQKSDILIDPNINNVLG